MKKEFQVKCLKLVSMLAGEFYNSVPGDDPTINDFIGWGWEGIEEARKRWNPDVAGFTVYAWWWVRYKMQVGYSEWKGYKRNSPLYAKNARYCEFEDGLHYSVTTTHKKHENMELWSKVFHLPPQLSLLLLMRYYYEIDNESICNIMCIKEKELRESLQTAINLLREMYEAEGKESGDSQKELHNG